jgi:hypothetical protein
MADSLPDRIIDHARQAAIVYAESLFPQGVPSEQLMQLAQGSAQTFFASTEEDGRDSDIQMYVGAFLWAYNERRRAIQAAPSATMHQHFIK